MKKSGLLWVTLILALTIFIALPIQAADLLHRLTHGDQYALVLGTVKAAGRGEMTLAVSKAVSGHQLDGKIRVVLPSGRLPFSPKAGEHLLVSIGRGGGKYYVKWGFFKVTSLRPNRLEIIGPGLSGSDRAALEHYVRSGGRENDFFGIFNMLFVGYPDCTFRPIYPKCRDSRTRHRVYVCTGRNDYSLTMSSTVGIELYPLNTYEESQPVRYRWQTSFGGFVLQDRFSSKIRNLGSEAVLGGRPEVSWLYWSLPLEKTSSRKITAKIRLTVEALRTGRELGQHTLSIECHNGWARVMR